MTAESCSHSLAERTKGGGVVAGTQDAASPSRSWSHMGGRAMGAGGVWPLPAMLYRTERVKDKGSVCPCSCLPISHWCQIVRGQGSTVWNAEWSKAGDKWIRVQTGQRVHKIDELEDMYRIVCCVTVQLLNICTCNLSKYIQYIHTTHNTETEVLQRSRESKKSRKIQSVLISHRR